MEYLFYANKLDATASDTHRYLNLNQLPTYDEPASKVEIENWPTLTAELRRAEEPRNLWLVFTRIHPPRKQAAKIVKLITYQKLYLGVVASTRCCVAHIRMRLLLLPAAFRWWYGRARVCTKTRILL